MQALLSPVVGRLDEVIEEEVVAHGVGVGDVVDVVAAGDVVVPVDADEAELEVEDVEVPEDAVETEVTGNLGVVGFKSIAQSSLG